MSGPSRSGPAPRTFLAGDSRRCTALLSSVSGPCRYACYLSRGRRALAIFHSARTFQLLFQPAFCKTLPARRQLLFRVILLLHEHKINFSYLFQWQSHSHTSSGEDPAPTAGGRILNELKPLGFYAGGPANASAVLVSAVSQSVQRLMELRQFRIPGVTDSRFTVVLCQRFSLRGSFFFSYGMESYSKWHLAFPLEADRGM